MPQGNSARDVMPAVGKVVLVGAGPGDPDLLTVKAAKAIEAADVIVYDRLVSPQILDLAPRGAALISVGKAPRNHSMPQSEINALLVRLALGGRHVIRLKGGDPFIFGRGGEEALELAKHKIPFEVIPGVTSAQGCAAAAGVPLTHRGLATSVRYITGHCREDMDLDYDWKGLADPDTTLAVYGARHRTADLRKAGRTRPGRRYTGSDCRQGHDKGRMALPDQARCAGEQGCGTGV